MSDAIAAPAAPAESTAADVAAELAANVGVESEKPADQPEKVKIAEQLQKDDKFAAKFAALGRKEKEIKAREKQLSDRQKALEEQLAGKEKEVESFKSLPERIKKDPLGVMKEHGLTFEQLAELYLNDGKPTEDQKLSEIEKRAMDRIEKLEKQLAEKEAKQTQEELDKQLNAYKAQITDFVNAPENDYELIRAENAVQLVFDVIEEHHNATADENGENGQILSNKEAADAVEAYLLEQAKSKVSLNKVKKLMQPADAPKAQPATETVAKTLSNTHASQVPNKSSKLLTQEESKREAAKLIRWDDQNLKWFIVKSKPSRKSLSSGQIKDSNF